MVDNADMRRGGDEEERGEEARKDAVCLISSMACFLQRRDGGSDRREAAQNICFVEYTSLI